LTDTFHRYDFRMHNNGEFDNYMQYQYVALQTITSLWECRNQNDSARPVANPNGRGETARERNYF